MDWRRSSLGARILEEVIIPRRTNSEALPAAMAARGIAVDVFIISTGVVRCSRFCGYSVGHREIILKFIKLRLNDMFHIRMFNWNY